MTSVGSDKATNNIRGYDSVRVKSSGHPTTTMVSKRTSSSEESLDKKGGIQQHEEPSKSRPDSPTTTYFSKRLEASTRPEIKRKIDEIVASTQKFNDLEKLLLYLKLPTGSSLCTKPNKDKPSSLVSSNRPAHWQGLNWIRTHLEESFETSLSKQDIYDDYRIFCEMSNYQVLSAADFGKLVKHVFPNIKVRRLGTRGNSKYCYSGINKKTEVRPPSLPNLELISTLKAGNGSILGADQQINDSANLVVCEWASKRIGCAFTSVVDLAKHLVSSSKVQGKSAAAFNLLVEHPSKQMLHKVRTGVLTHKETNLHLQRTIQRRQMNKQKQQSEANKQLNLNSHPKSQTPIPKQVDKSKTDEPMEIICSDYPLKIDEDSGHSRSSDSSFSGSDVTIDHDVSSPKKFCSSLATHQNNSIDNKDRNNPKESPNTRKLKPLMPKTPISESQSRQLICVMSSPLAGTPTAGTPTRQTTTPVLTNYKVNDQTYLITIGPNTPIIHDVKGSGAPSIESIKKLPTIVGTSSIPVSSQQLQVVRTSETSAQAIRNAIVASPCPAVQNCTTRNIGERGLRVVSVPVQSNKPVQQQSIQKVNLNNTPSNLNPNIPMPVYSIQQTPISMASSSEPVQTSTASIISCVSSVLATNSSASPSQRVSIAIAGGSIPENLVKNHRCVAASLNQATVPQQKHQSRPIDSKSLQQEKLKISEPKMTDNSSSATLLKLIGLQKLPQQNVATQDKQNTGQLHLRTGSQSNSLLRDMLVLQNNGSIPEWQNACSSPSLQVLNSTIPRTSAISANANAKTSSMKSINASQVVPASNISTVYNLRDNTPPVISNCGSSSVPSSPSYISHSQIAQASGQHYVIQTLPSPGPTEGNVFSFTPIANTSGILQNGVPMCPKPMPKPKATMGVKLDLSEQNPQLVMCQDAPRQVPKTARQELLALRGGQSNIRPVRHRRVSSSSRKKLSQPYCTSSTKVATGVLTSPGNSRSATPVSPMLTNPSNIQFFQSESESMPPPSPNPVTIEVSPAVTQASNNLLSNSSNWGRHRRLSGPPAQFALTNVCSQLINKNVTNRTLPVRQSQRSQSVPLPDLGYEALIPKSMWRAKESLTQLPQLPQLQVISISEEDFLGSDDQDGTDMSTTTSVSAGANSMLEHWDLDGEDSVLTNRNAASTMLTSTLNCSNTATEDVMSGGLAQDNLLQQMSTNSSFSGSDNSMDMETTDSFDASTWSLGHFSTLPCGS